MQDTLQLKAYGKINLGLDVLGVREDGYHEVKMIMQTVKLYDKLTFRILEEDEIRVHTNLNFLPVDENNLVYKAVKLIKDKYGIQKGLDIDLYKCIPVAAGMAGGSSDCAAALVGASRMFGLKLGKKTLMKLGVELGADVPYCILRGTALSEGIGELLTSLPPIPDCFILIAKPHISVSTKYVYQHLDEKKEIDHPDIDGMIQAIQDGNLEGITGRFGNVLEAVTIPEYPVIRDIKNMMLEAGAMNSLMSGSGPTVFGFFKEEETARNAAERIREKGLANQIFVVQPFNQYVTGQEGK